MGLFGGCTSCSAFVHCRLGCKVYTKHYCVSYTRQKPYVKPCYIVNGRYIISIQRYTMVYDSKVDLSVYNGIQ